MALVARELGSASGSAGGRIPTVRRVVPKSRLLLATLVGLSLLVLGVRVVLPEGPDFVDVAGDAVREA